MTTRWLFLSQMLLVMILGAGTAVAFLLNLPGIVTNALALGTASSVAALVAFMNRLLSAQATISDLPPTRTLTTDVVRDMVDKEHHWHTGEGQG